MKVKILLRSYLQMFFQNFLYLTSLFTIIAFGLMAGHLLNISELKKYSLLLISIFLLSLLSTMNLYYNDSKRNIYLKQKVNSYWADVLSQFLVALITNTFSAVLIFIFSLILNQDLLLDVIGIFALFSCGMLGSAIATLFKTQWYYHSSLGQVGVLVFVYLAFLGSVIDLLNHVEFILPPLSKMIMTLQLEASITKLLPTAIQAFLYSIILFLVSSFFYKKSKSN